MGERLSKIIFTLAFLFGTQPSFGALRECLYNQNSSPCPIAQNKIVHIELNGRRSVVSGEQTKFIYDSDHSDMSISYVGSVFFLLMDGGIPLNNVPQSYSSGNDFGIQINDLDSTPENASGKTFEVNHISMGCSDDCGSYKVIKKNIVQSGTLDGQTAYEIKDLDLAITSNYVLKDGTISIHSR